MLNLFNRKRPRLYPDPHLGQAQQEARDLRRLLWAEREKVEKLEAQLEKEIGKREMLIEKLRARLHVLLEKEIETKKPCPMCGGKGVQG